MNILLIATRYPEMDIKINKATEFFQIYATEWAKQGHNVTVFYCKPEFPQFTKRLFFILGKILKNKNIKEYNYGYMESEDTEYVYNNVTVVRKKIRKSFPKMLCSKKVVRNRSIEILERIKNEKINPDIIISDFINPATMIGEEIKKKINIPLFSIFHETDFGYLSRLYTKKRVSKTIKSLDGIIFRSYPAMEKYKKSYGLKVPSFICPSGIPQNIIKTDTKLISESDNLNLITVGRLIKRKNFHVIIKSISNIIDENNKKLINLIIIGEGPERQRLEKIVNENKIANNVKFMGKVSREAVLDSMDKSEIFVFVPNNETFGMVYVEAMAKGCIVIGAKGTGIDGIIKNGENGFLIEPGNCDELERILFKIQKMKKSEKEKISLAAINTAKNMTDDTLAFKLISKLAMIMK